MGRQTADTFLASATFLDLLQIWPPVDPEIASKIKFAKYHGLRIAKALKAGEDPNLSNPKLEAHDDDEHQPLDPNDPEVQALNGSVDRQPTVEEAPNEHDPSAVAVPQPSELKSIGDLKGADRSIVDGEVSPLDPPDEVPANQQEYFPTVPEGYSNDNHSVLPEAPPNEPGVPLPRGTSPSAPGTQPLDKSVAPLSPPTDLPSISAITPTLTGAPDASSGVPSPLPSQLQPPPEFVPPPPARPLAAPGYISPPRAKPPATFVPDEEAIAKAQKHARWAISALNFEDVTTAISELRGALKTLGAE